MRAVLLAAAFLTAAASDDPVIAERGHDRITASQARALIAAADPQTRHRLAATPGALTDLLRNVLIQRAIAEQAQAEHWDQRPDIAILLQRAHDQVTVQSYLAAHATVPAGYPSDADLQVAYDRNKAQFMQPRGYHLAQIFISKASLPAPDAHRSAWQRYARRSPATASRWRPPPSRSRGRPPPISAGSPKPSSPPP